MQEKGKKIDLTISIHYIYYILREYLWPSQTIASKTIMGYAMVSLKRQSTPLL